MKMASKTFHKGKYYVAFKRGFEDCKKGLTVTIDKVFESDSLRISLSEEDDPTFLFVLNVTRLDYEDLKKQQGLLIDFDNFPSQLVRLLQQCASNNMFLMLQQANPLQFYFEIVEHNEFKRLVHLSLKTGPANDTDIKQHMAETINVLKKTLSSLKSTTSSSEAIWNDKCLNFERKVSDLTHALSKMEEDRLRHEADYQETIKQERERMTQEKIQYQRTLENNTKTQLGTVQESLDMKIKQIDELNALCKKLHDNIGMLENQLCDKSQRLNLIETEVQKSHIEVATLKAKNSTLEREIVEKDNHYHQLNSRCINLEKSIKDNSDIIKELNNSLQIAKKEKASLEERLALSESRSVKTNEAINSTSEQLMKANQIISKQNCDLIEMKEKLLCRTAIALEQEKVIERNSKEIDKLEAEVLEVKQNMDKVRAELQSLREKYEINEKALQDKEETIKNNNMVIQWLHKKMEESCPPTDMLHKSSCKQTRSSSTPYFLPRNGNSHTDNSDETINFYGTSQLSNNDSQESEPQKSIRVGLDPKYLKPASDDNKVKGIETIGSAGTKSANSQGLNGKENKIMQLPKVNYREKKSTKGSTYRATPVSAYFP